MTDGKVTDNGGDVHTPGEWRIEGRRGAGYIISAGVNFEADGPASYVGVLDPMFYIAGEPRHLDADARLIAAAPDLLEALVLAEDVLSRFPFSSDVWPNGTHPNAGIEQIRAAIAKATGQ